MVKSLKRVPKLNVPVDLGEPMEVINWDLGDKSEKGYKKFISSVQKSAVRWVSAGKDSQDYEDMLASSTSKVTEKDLAIINAILWLKKSPDKSELAGRYRNAEVRIRNKIDDGNMAGDIVLVIPKMQL